VTFVKSKAYLDLIDAFHSLSPSRYAAGDIYTYTGAILLAVNPFYRINIYGEAKLAEYQREGAAKVQDTSLSHSFSALEIERTFFYFSVLNSNFCEPVSPVYSIHAFLPVL